MDGRNKDREMEHAADGGKQSSPRGHWKRGPSDALVPTSYASTTLVGGGEDEEELGEGHAMTEEELEAQLGLTEAGPRAVYHRSAMIEYDMVTCEGKLLTLDRFQHIMEGRWGLNRRRARAVFLAIRRSHEGYITRHEFLLLREAFVHPPPDEWHPRLVHIRLACLFYYYDASARGHDATCEDMEELTHDLVGESASHSQRMATLCFPSIGQHTWTLGAFLAHMQSDALALTLAREGLSLDELHGRFRSLPAKAYPREGDFNLHLYDRVVYDGRSERSVGAAEHGAAGFFAPQTVEVTGFAVNPHLRSRL